MTSYLQSLLTVIAPILIFFFPGIGLTDAKSERNMLAYVSRLLLWSFTSVILVTFAGSFLALPRGAAAGILICITAGGVWYHRRTFFTLPTLWYSFGAATLMVAPLAAFSIPFLIQKQGLPTGDAQKAIYWAQSISQHGNLPDYSLSYLKLNRDPVDFYTPGLHTTIALLLDMAPHDMPAVGFFAILASLVAAVIAASIGKDIFDTPGKIFPATLIMLLVLTNTRFLRYLREPGYHLQNVVGEVLLFGLLMLALSLIHRWRTKDAILACICAIALLVSHQFSSFIAAFALAPALVIFIVSRRHMVINTIRQHPTFGIAGILTGTALGVGGLMLGLQAKIPYLFTATPHLLQELPALTDYPRLLGNWWFALGFTGLLLLGIHTFRKHLHRRETAAFCLTTLVLFVLSQAPRFFIDTPPIRALFYLVIPLSICGAYLLAMLLSYVNSIPAMKARLAGKSTILFLLAVATIYSTTQAYQEVPVSSRTNATLTPGLEYMIKNISKYVSEGSVLSDDYNKRSGSWLLLSGRPTFSRLASDLRRPMLESRQSAERMDMYIKQLDFEKIYSLGNWPGIVPLMNKHGITAVVGAVGSSASVFSHNPLLQTAAAVDSMYVFGLHPAKTVSDNTDPDRAAWLLKASTLANDIGDDEDTFQKLPASLPTTRLSAAQFEEGRTYRVSNAVIMTLNFNMADYSQALWDKDDDGQVDTTMELFFRPSRPAQGLTVKTALRDIPITSEHISLLPSDIPADDRGHIVITITNPKGQNVAIDIIALGLARVP